MKTINLIESVGCSREFDAVRVYTYKEICVGDGIYRVNHKDYCDHYFISINGFTRGNRMLLFNKRTGSLDMIPEHNWWDEPSRNYLFTKLENAKVCFDIVENIKNEECN